MCTNKIIRVDLFSCVRVLFALKHKLAHISVLPTLFECRTRCIWQVANDEIHAEHYGPTTKTFGPPIWKMMLEPKFSARVHACEDE